MGYKILKKVFMFDVESDGLHGEGFAFGVVKAYITTDGYVVIDRHAAAAGVEEVKDQWVKENVIPGLKKAIDAGEVEVLEDSIALRNKFWDLMQQAKKEGYEIWSDCNWPVETNFLSACIADDPESRAWEGPYPLKDLATLLDINISREELSGLKYDHNPVHDAEASVVCLGKVLRGEV